MSNPAEPTRAAVPVLCTLAGVAWAGVIALLFTTLAGGTPRAVESVVDIVAATVTTVAAVAWFSRRAPAAQPDTIRIAHVDGFQQVARTPALVGAVRTAPRGATYGGGLPMEAVEEMIRATERDAYWNSAADLIETLVETRADDPQID